MNSTKETLIEQLNELFEEMTENQVLYSYTFLSKLFGCSDKKEDR